jgi:hypothetical protein
MSAVASFYLLEKSKLEELVSNAQIIAKKSFFSKKITDNYWDYLTNNSIKLEGLDGSGYIYSNVIVFLQEMKNIDLLGHDMEDVANTLTDKRNSSHFLFSNQQRERFISQLKPSQFSLAELQNFNRDFSEEGDEETAGLALSAIRLLHKNLGQIQTENHVLLLIVG